MLKLLVKKQMAELFRSYVYDPKRNRTRSKAGTAALFILFGFLMIVIIGGMFTMMSLAICPALYVAGMNWLYFDLIGLIAVLMGVLGSVFTTFSSLYLAKDNDLLLSMPIPVKYIVAARLTSVYLMGLLYSGVVLIPAVIVYWATTPFSVMSVVGCVVYVLVITLLVFVLSCLLGWVVAKISVKLKNKSFITVILSLAFIALYYVLYFNAQTLIGQLVENAAVYGEKIKGAAYPVYLFGRIGEGYWPSLLIFAVFTALLLAIMWIILKRTFLSIAISTSAVSKKKTDLRQVSRKSVFSALLGKEFSKFVSSPNYMLNCGFGAVMLPALGILALIKGRDLADLIYSGEVQMSIGTVAVLVITGICWIMTAIDTTAPSVSLEGRSLWVLQSLPVNPKSVLDAKISMQLILTFPPLVFCSACCVAVMRPGWALSLLIFALPAAFELLLAVFGAWAGLKFPNLNWTNEIYPIKQSVPVFFSMFGGWICAGIIPLVSLLILRNVMSCELSLLMLLCAIMLATAFLYAHLANKGAEMFSKL